MICYQSALSQPEPVRGYFDAQRRKNMLSAHTPYTAALAWDPPAVVTNVAGYRIYYGTAPGVYFQSPGNGVNAATANTYTVTNLQSATTYYFVVTAYNISSVEGGPSNEVSKSIP